MYTLSLGHQQDRIVDDQPEQDDKADHAEQVERLKTDLVDDRDCEHAADGRKRDRDHDQDRIFQRPWSLSTSSI